MRKGTVLVHRRPYRTPSGVYVPACGSAALLFVGPRSGESVATGQRLDAAHFRHIDRHPINPDEDIRCDSCRHPLVLDAIPANALDHEEIDV